jgi:hypothetical protein
LGRLWRRTLKGNIGSLLLWVQQDGDGVVVDKRLRLCPIH